jgi:excisionase family DNA binding protein
VETTFSTCLQQRTTKYLQPKNCNMIDNLIVATTEQLRLILREELQRLCQSNIDTTSTNDGVSRILTLTEFCEYTNLSKQTAYKLTSAQKVPHSKRGKRLYFDREKVDAWLLENQVATQADIKGRANDYLLKKQNQRRV